MPPIVFPARIRPTIRPFRLLLATVYLLPLTMCAPCAAADDISQFSQHFNKPGGDIAPWMFIPQENIKETSTTEHPGMMAVWENGKGRDIKGILREPLRLSDYPTPWEFQLGLVQNFDAMVGLGTKSQANYAIGPNLAVTFSDPSTWPSDRTQRPADTREFQLLVVHLGTTGEAGVGLPQFTEMPHPETYLVWGRGDLGYQGMGDWGIPHIW